MTFETNECNPDLYHPFETVFSEQVDELAKQSLLGGVALSAAGGLLCVVSKETAIDSPVVQGIVTAIGAVVLAGGGVAAAHGTRMWHHARTLRQRGL